MAEQISDRAPSDRGAARSSPSLRARAAGLLALVFAASAIAGCGSTDHVDDPSGGATSTSTVSASTCVSVDAIKQHPDQFVPHGLARRLPPPQPGTRICRIDPRTRGTIYVIGQGPGGREILEYYGPALDANGCETDSIGPPGSALSIAGDLGLEFRCPEGSGTVVAPKNGDHYVIAWSD
jgi:hypothetical protein